MATKSQAKPAARPSPNNQLAETVQATEPITRDKVAIATLPDAGAVFIMNGVLNKLLLPEGYEFTELHTLTDCKFIEVEPSPRFRIEGLVGVLIPSGVELKIKVSSFKLGSGSLIAYYAKSVDKRAAAQ